MPSNAPVLHGRNTHTAHAAAIGLGRGRGGLEEFTDAAVNDPALKRIRLLTEAHGDPSIHEDGVVVRVRLKEGGEIGTHLTESLGNLKRPLSDARLEEKFRDQAKVINPAQADEAIRACWTIDELDDTSRLIAPCIPG